MQFHKDIITYNVKLLRYLVFVLFPKRFSTVFPNVLTLKKKRDQALEVGT